MLLTAVHYDMLQSAVHSQALAMYNAVCGGEPVNMVTDRPSINNERLSAYT